MKFSFVYSSGAEGTSKNYKWIASDGATVWLDGSPCQFDITSQCSSWYHHNHHGFMVLYIHILTFHNVDRHIY